MFHLNQKQSINKIDTRLDGSCARRQIYLNHWRIVFSVQILICWYEQSQEERGSQTQQYEQIAGSGVAWHITEITGYRVFWQIPRFFPMNKTKLISNVFQSWMEGKVSLVSERITTRYLTNLTCYCIYIVREESIYIVHLRYNCGPFF